VAWVASEEWEAWVVWAVWAPSEANQDPSKCQEQLVPVVLEVLEEQVLQVPQVLVEPVVLVV
jgi:hypothetical protein